jgi:hypothetical protein
VPWKPKFPPVAVHPAQQFDFRVAEVSGVGDRTVGHLLVFAEPYARQAGRLWWKTLSNACLTLEVWSSIDGEFDESFLFADEDVDAAVEGLRRGEWQMGGAASTTYLLRWLDLDESRRIVHHGSQVDGHGQTAEHADCVRHVRPFETGRSRPSSKRRSC